MLSQSPLSRAPASESLPQTMLSSSEQVWGLFGSQFALLPQTTLSPVAALPHTTLSFSSPLLPHTMLSPPQGSSQSLPQTTLSFSSELPQTTLLESPVLLPHVMLSQSAPPQSPPQTTLAS